MRSIRSQLTATLCLAIGALLVAAGLFVFFAAREVLEDQFDETLVAKGRAIITATEVDDGELELELTVEDFAGFGEGGDYFEIRRGGGVVVIRSPSLEAETIGTIEPPEGDEPRIVSGAMPDGRRARFFVQRFRARGKKWTLFPDLHVIVASPTAELDRSIAGLGVVLAVAGAGTLLVTVPLVRAALARGLRPLGDLSAQVQSIQTDRLDRRVDESRMPAELLPVAAALNAWLGRLEVSFERERRFSSHAAHELRTPLAELKALAESGARWPEEATPERCGEVLEVANELEALLEKLALLARADAGRQPLQPAPVDLAAACAAAAERFERLAAERDIRIEPRIEGGPFVSDPELFGTILGNLLGNAVAYSPPGSRVRVELSPQRIRVANLAPELDPADLPHLFERFWRKDAARTGYGHSGLGLSIVQACVQVLGGTCQATLGPGHELEIVVTWKDSAS